MSNRPVEIEYLLRDGVSSGLNRIERNATSMGRTVEREGGRIDSMFKRAATGALAFFSINKAVEYGRSIIQIRGEMQGLALAFETMLGSKSKADRMMSDVMEFAMGTPYTVTEVADNVKQLIAMNAAGDDVMATFKALGDVAAGVNVPISRIAINYGQVAALGKLQEREIRDFAMAGIPIVSELAKQFDVAENKIMAMVEAGQVGFPAVQKAFASMAGEGGKFHNMMEKLNSTVTGQLSRLQDAIQQMMNKIGESNEGLIYKAIDGASYLIENYEKIGRILGVLIASYGAYRAALIATVAVQKVAQAVEWIRIFNQQTAALSRMTQAQILLNKAVGANPYIKLASILMTVGGLIWAFAKNSGAAAKELSGLEKATQAASKEFEGQRSKVQALSDMVNDGNAAYDARKKAIDDLRGIIPEYNASIDEEGRLINQNTEAIKEYLTQLERQIKMKAAQEELEANYRNKRNQERDLKVLREELAAAEAYNRLAARPAVQSKIGTTGMQAISMGAGSGTAKPTDGLKYQIEQTEKAISDTNENIRELNDEINATAETGTSAAETITAKNKAYWESQKKDAEAALAGMEASAKDSEAWNRQMSLLNEANAKLQIWDFGSPDKKAADRITREAERVAQKLIDLQIKLVDDTQQARVDAMADGLEKTLAQNELNHRREVEQIEQFGAELLAAYQAVDKNIAELPEADRAMLATMTAAAGVEYANADSAGKQSESDRLDAMLEQYADYATRRQALEENYDRDVAALRSARTEANAEQIDRAIAEAGRQHAAAISELDAAVQGSSTLWGQLFDDLAHRTNAELQAIIDNARQVLDYVGGTPDADIEAKFGLTREQLLNLKGNAADLGAAYDALYRKTEQFNRRNPFAALISSARSMRGVTADLKKAQEDLARAEAAGDKAGARAAGERVGQLNRQKDLFKGDLKAAATSAVSYLGDVGGSLQQIGEAAGDAGLASFGKTLGEVTDIAGKFLSGDIIGGAISAVTTGLTAIFSSRAKYKAALRQMELDAETFAHQYKLVLADIRLAGEGSVNIFSEDAFSKAITALRQTGEYYDRFIEKVNKKDLPDFGYGWLTSIIAGRKEVQEITTDLQNIWIQTRNKTLFRKSKGVYLKDMYPELFDGENGFNVEAARVLLETNNQLNDEARRQIQEVIDLYDQMKEAEVAFKEYLGQTFGEIGDSLGDSIVAAFEEGTDAMENWGESFENVLDIFDK